MTSKRLKLPNLKLRNSSFNMAINVISGRETAASGLPSSRKALVYLCLKLSSSVAQLLVRYRQAGMLVDTVFPRISSRRLTGLLFGHSFVLRKLSTCQALRTHTSCINTCIPQKLEPALEVEWEAPSVWRKCLKIAVMNARFKMTSCKRRKSIISKLLAVLRICRFINTTAGWINLLLMSSSGPVKIPVGAW